MSGLTIAPVASNETVKFGKSKRCSHEIIASGNGNGAAPGRVGAQSPPIMGKADKHKIGTISLEILGMAVSLRMSPSGDEAFLKGASKSNPANKKPGRAVAHATPPTRADS